MKISIISTSHRKNSQSARIGSIMNDYISEIDHYVNCSCIDMFESKIPLWPAEKNKNNQFVDNNIQKISLNLKSADGFIFIVPEYGGMATPNSKNFFLIFNNGELFHKPALLVSVSSGNGGAYPISDLRSSSYKNSHITWIPENIIIRNVEQFMPGNHGELIPKWLDDRIVYSLNLIIEYARCLKPIQNVINKKEYGNGM